MVDEKLKMAVISGAAEALKHKKQNPNRLDDDVLREITDNAEKIAEKIDVGEEEL